MDLRPNLAWLTGNFEPVRPEALHDLGASVKTCLRCGALVPGYTAAWHLNWHERIDPHSPAAKDI